MSSVEPSTRTPESNYATRDNIVPPPEVTDLERLEAVGEVVLRDESPLVDDVEGDTLDARVEAVQDERDEDEPEPDEDDE